MSGRVSKERTVAKKKGDEISGEIERIRMKISSIREKGVDDDLDEARIDELSARLDHESSRKDRMVERSERLKYIK